MFVMLCGVCCLVVWCVVAVAVRVVVVVVVAVAVCVRVSFLLPLKNAPVCTLKTLPFVLSKRPCHLRHDRFDSARRRFESTHGSVLNVHTGASRAVSPSLSFSPVCFSSHVYLSSCISVPSHLFACVSVSCVSHIVLSNRCLSLLIFLSFFCLFSVLSVSVLNDDDDDHSSGRLFLNTRLVLP